MTFVPVLYTNKGASTLTAGIAAGSPGDVVTLHIQTGDASRFNPSGTPGTTDVAIGNEYLTITAGWGTTSLTATRGQYGTPAEQHFVNDPVTETLTASELAALFQTAHPLGGVLTGTLPNPGLAAGAVTLDRLAQSGATTGQVPQWNGSAWVPGSSSGSYTLPDATTGAIGGVKIDTAPVSGDPVALTQAGTALPAGMLGATGTTAAAGNDARLSDQRTPLDGSVTTAKLAYLSSIPVAQSTVPANPPVGDQALFIDTADGKLKRVDHTGAVTTIEDGGGSGTVTSVGLSAPAWLSVAGTPVTTSGTLAVTANTQAANQILAGPTTGASATPAFRALIAEDLPLATTGAFGAVKPDGTTITIASGVISSVGGGSSSWTLIAEYVGNGTSGTTTWSSIAGTYRALKLVGVIRATPATNYQSLLLRLNGDTGANYNRHVVTASAGAVSESETNSQTSLFLADAPSGNQAAGDALSVELTIWQYADTTFYKQVQSRATIFPSSGGNVFDEWIGGLWLSTTAITSVTALLDAGNFATGTKLALYGIS